MAGAGANKAGGPGATGGAPGAAGEGEAAENKEAEPQEYQRPDYPENLRRNPFRPVVEVLSPLDSLDGGSEDEARSVEPLERFSVGELELSVIISETAVPKAMFLDPDGFGHVVKEGDRIGRQGGTITDIRDNEVDVQETTGEDESAQSTVRTIRLREVDIQSTKEEGEELSKAEREALQRLLQR